MPPAPWAWRQGSWGRAARRWSRPSRTNTRRCALSTQNRGQEQRWLSLEQARANRTPVDWRRLHAAQRRPSLGVEVLDDYPLETLRPYIDWTPFFHAWQMKGSYPKILDDPEKGETARKLFQDAKAMLERVDRGEMAHGAGRISACSPPTR